MDRHHPRDRLLDVRRDLVRASSSPRPTRRWPTRATSRSTCSCTSGIVLLLRSRARSIGGTLWLDGATAALAAGGARRGRDLRARRRRDRGLDLRRRHEPRVPAGRRAPALRRLRRLLADRLEAGSALAAPRARRPVDGARGHRLPLPVGRRDVRRGDVDRHPVADGAAAHRVVRLGGRPDARRARGRRSTAARRPGRLRARRDGNPRLRPLRSRQRARDRPRDGRARARRRPARRHVPREPPPLRADPRGGDD